MSYEVGGIVMKKRCGGPVRRVLLLALASVGGNDGRDIYTSVPQLARDSEVDPRTVQRQLKAFLDEGLLELVGKRQCPRGYTNEYRLRLSAIHALPNIVRREDMEIDEPRPAVTPGAKSPLAVRRPTPAKTPETQVEFASVVEVDPRHSVTPDIPPPPAQCHPTLDPSDTSYPQGNNTVRASELLADAPHPIPADWKPTPKLVKRALEQLHFTEEELSDANAEFIEYWTTFAKRKVGNKTERGWNTAFGTRLNDLAARWRTHTRKQTTRPGAGGGPRQDPLDRALSRLGGRPVDGDVIEHSGIARRIGTGAG